MILGCAATFAAPAFAADAVPPKLAPNCSAKSAKKAEIAAIAGDPHAFEGKCVKVSGFWRDQGVYPTFSEAYQPDAQSFAFLDRRRLGLYLSDADNVRAPHGPTPATLIGTVGECAVVPKAADAVMPGYCGYKPGAYMVVGSVELAK